MAQPQMIATFEFQGDNFEHAWYFNRFRCDRMGSSVLVTTALATESAGILAVNGFVLGKHDLTMNRQRSLDYLRDLSASISEPALPQTITAPPARIYPVNIVNLARIGDTAEIGLYRYSIHSMLTRGKPAKSAKESASKREADVPCYPVVMFRSSLKIQAALLLELFSSTDDGEQED
jgi:hypothetical protein